MALNHTTTLDDDTDAMLAPDPLVTDIEALNRRHAFVMNGGKAMVMNFDHDPNLGETLTFSTQADFRGNHANRRTVVLRRGFLCESYLMKSAPESTDKTTTTSSNIWRH